MLRAVLIVAGVLTAIVAIVTAIGYALPRGHMASRSETFTQPADRIFAVLQDVERYPAWRSDVTSVEVLSRAPSLRWREHGSNGTITFETPELQPPSRMVARIADPSLPFGGTWIYVLSSPGGRTELTITENGEVYNPVFRFMSRFVFGHTATIDRYLRDLRKHLGEG